MRASPDCFKTHELVGPELYLSRREPIHVCRPVDLSLCRLVDRSLCRPVDLSLCRLVDLSLCRPVDLSLCRLVDLSLCRPVDLFLRRLVDLWAVLSVAAVNNNRRDRRKITNNSDCKANYIIVHEPLSLSTQ